MFQVGDRVRLSKTMLDLSSRVNGLFPNPKITSTWRGTIVDHPVYSGLATVLWDHRGDVGFYHIHNIVIVKE